jgi:putative DNA primase/helicase
MSSEQGGQGEGPGTPEPSGGGAPGAGYGGRAIVEGIAAARPVPLRVVGQDEPPPPDDDAGNGPGGTPADGGPSDLELSFQPRSDLGNARRLIARFGADLMYVDRVGWFAWDDRRWSAEIGAFEAQKRAQQTGELIFGEARAMDEAGPRDGETDKQFDGRVTAHRKFAVSCGNSGKIDGMLKQAQPHLLVPADRLDAHDYVINLANVALDLGRPDFSPDSADDEAPRTPELRELAHDRTLRATRITEAVYDADADCPRFRHFLGQIAPDAGVRAFLQRWFGYCLTGDTSEQSLMCCYGTGSNGKSTLLETMAHVLGDYAVTVPIATFLQDDRKSGGQATPDIARLPGARLVLASEPETGARLSESTVKTITGGERVTARKLFQEQFEFEPKFKLVISFNAKPSVRGQDEGIWRRILLVPFKVHIPRSQRDPHLKARLLAERSGILNWMLDGYRLWREEGLQPPAEVVAATQAYRAESDPIGQFLDQRVLPREGGVISAATLYESYETWASDNGYEAVSKTLFGRRMSDKGYEKDKQGGFIVYLGIVWNPDAGAGGLDSSGLSTPHPGV